MAKALSEMSLEELWRLFPIQLTAYQHGWADWYQEEEARLRPLFQPGAVGRISHIGSTAVPGLWAKPIVDILLEAAPGAEWAPMKRSLLENGYLCMSQSAGRISFNRGYTKNGFAPPVFHLHLRRLGDCDELYFRDYLRQCPQAAKEYEALKLSVWKRFEHDRDGYTAAKTQFVQRYTRRAREIWPGRYEPGQDENRIR